MMVKQNTFPGLSVAPSKDFTVSIWDPISFLFSSLSFSHFLRDQVFLSHFKLQGALMEQTVKQIRKTILILVHINFVFLNLALLLLRYFF